MGKPFEGKTTYSLLKGNPKLTGNVKLIVDSKENLFIESIDGSSELSRNKYKNISINKDSSWENDVYSFMNEGRIPLNIFYSVKNERDFLSIENEYYKQYYTEYQKGASVNISKFYTEQKKYFVPTWFEPNNIPEYFIILRVPNPVSISTKDADLSKDLGDIRKEIYNDNYKGLDFTQNGLNEEESDYFFQTILKDSKIIKEFSLKEGTALGDYLRNYINNPSFPDSSLTINWNKGEQSTVNGISLRKGGFDKESFDLFSDAFAVDRTVLGFDELITNKFSELGVVHPNIINMEFLFDDEDVDDYSIHRYFGLYISEENISKFRLSKEQVNKNDILKVDIEKDISVEISNKNRLNLFIDYLEDSYKTLGSDFKNRQMIPYVRSSSNKIFNLSVEDDWDNDKILLKDSSANIKDFIGFSKTSLGSIECANTSKVGRSYFDIKLLEPVSSLEVRLRNVDGGNLNLLGTTTFIGNVDAIPGFYQGNIFSLQGSVSDILNALSSAINNYSEKDEDFNLWSLVKGDRLIIFTRGQNEYWNNYKFLVYSDTQNANDKILINGEKGESEKPQDFQDFNILSDPNYIGSVTTNIFYKKGKFVGGKNNTRSRVRVKSEDKEYFNKELYLKTKDWYSKITGVTLYLDEPVFKNGRIVDFINLETYTNIEIEDEIFIFNGSFIKIFDLGINYINIASIYPIRVFDTDTFVSDYSKVEKPLLEDFNFKTLAGELGETTGEIPYIKNEYDRLNENLVPELALKGKIIPTINKWVYDNGLDVRENPYRLTSNTAFSFDNFSPNIKHKLPDVRYFTHEWFYLGKYPDGILPEDRMGYFSYFNQDLYDLKDIDNDNFKDYFTQFYVEYNTNLKNITINQKYSIFGSGDGNKAPETFFRGSKIKIYKRLERSALIFNAKSVGVSPTEDYNDYKFSAVLVNDQENALKYEVIQNNKFKNITFVISCDLETYILDNKVDITRDNLYSLVNKRDQNGDIADITLSGWVEIGSEQVLVGNNFFNQIIGIRNTINGSVPNFRNQVTRNENGGFNDLIFEFVGSKITIQGSDISSVDENIINIKNTAQLFEETSSGGSFTNFFTLLNRINNANSGYSLIRIVYKEGGANYFTRILSEISFSSIFDKVNTGSPEIIYTTILEDGTTVSNDFLLRFEEPAVCHKVENLTTKDLLAGSLNSLGFGIKGKELVKKQTSRLVPTYRYNGGFNPKVKDVIFFRELGDKNPSFNESIKNDIFNKNVEFFSTWEGFGIYKNLFINKVNETNPQNVLSLPVSDEPRYWKTGDISIDKLDAYIFRSNWDLDFYRKYTLKTSFLDLPGYIEPKEIPFFFGSSLMKIEKDVYTQNFNLNDIEILRDDLVNITAIIKNKEKLVKYFTEKIKDLILKWVNPDLNFGLIDTLDDDIREYIISNILPRYEYSSIEVFIKYTTKNVEVNLLEDTKTAQELLQSGFSRLSNFNARLEEGNNFDLRFTFNKPTDRNITLAFIVKNNLI